MKEKLNQKKICYILAYCFMVISPLKRKRSIKNSLYSKRIIILVLLPLCMSYPTQVNVTHSSSGLL